MKNLKTRLGLLISFTCMYFYGHSQTWDGSQVFDYDAWRCGRTGIGIDPASIDPYDFSKFIVTRGMSSSCEQQEIRDNVIGHHELGIFGLKGSFGVKEETKWISLGRTLLSEDQVDPYGLRINWNSFSGIFRLEQNESGLYETHIKWGGSENKVQGSLRFDVLDGSDRSTEVMTLTEDGQLGINNSAPLANLDVNGTFRLNTGTLANGNILTSDASGFASWQAPPNDWSTMGNANTNSSSFIGTTGNNHFNIRTNNLPRMQIAANGFVGIGITNPVTKFHVVGNSVFTATSVTNPSSAAYIRGNSTFSTAATPDYTWWNNDQTGIFHPSFNVMGFSINGIERMRIESSGNVEFANQLKISGGNPGLDKVLKSDANGLASWENQFSGLVGPGIIQIDAGGVASVVPGSGSGGLWSTSNGTDIFASNIAAKIGIGTITPNAKLTIAHSDINGGIILDRLNAGAVGDPSKSQISFRQNNIEKWSIGNDKDEDGSQNFFIYDASAGAGTRFLIDPNGNVGIGVSVPTNKLEVCGTIKATKFNVAANWCDYVFEEDYSLRTIEEVEQFIQANKHLPDVPSGAEVQQNGVELGSMITNHMLKIEELTLYIIQQNKRIIQLESRLGELESNED